MKQILGIFTLIFGSFLYAQQNVDYLKVGNDFLNQNKLEEAENIFRIGLDKNPGNVILMNQLSLSLINQKENYKAQEILDKIIKSDSLNIGALWYSGINNYLRKPPRLTEAIKYFEKAYPLIDKNSGQYFGVNFFIGNSYKILLYSDGLNYDEVSRMLETLRIYTELQPDADDYGSTKLFIEKIEKNRMPRNVKKWIITNQINS